jgi:predicted acetyltransferase
VPYTPPGPVAPEEFDAFADALAAAFHDDPRGAWVDRARAVHEPERAWAIRDGGRIVATAASLGFELTVPGGPVPMAGVTAVGVRPTHRRRGLLTSLMRAQLERLREGGEAIAGLWASEARIYGRFGYGLATRVAQLEVRTERASLRPGLDAGGLVADQLRPADARADLRALYDDVRRGQPGLLARGEPRWDRVLDDPEGDRDGAKPLRVVVVRDDAGAPQAYAVYAVRVADDGIDQDGEALVREVLAATPAARVAVWEQLLGLDLVRRLRWADGPADVGVGLLLTDPRAARAQLGDGLWVRLVDVDRALAGRRYATELDVVLDVDDGGLPANAGRHRLAGGPSGAACAPTTDAPDLRLGTDTLAAAFLGGPSLRALADAGRVQELTPGGVDAATAAFRSPREPWCADVF